MRFLRLLPILVAAGCTSELPTLQRSDTQTLRRPAPVIEPPSHAPTLAPSHGSFVWPVNGWIIANERYRYGGDASGGKVHTGSADIGAPQGVPVFAARGGTARQWFAKSKSYRVKIEHENGYATEYAHLIEASFLRPGQRVEAGQLIGWSGRTGIAETPHVHFALYRNDKRLPIPGLAYGTWVSAGAPIPGPWELPTLDPVAVNGYAFNVTVTGDRLEVRAAPEPSAKIAGTLTRWEVVKVVEARGGWYGIGPDRWIPSSGVRAERFPIFPARAVHATALRTGPGDAYPENGSLAGNATVIVVAEENGYRKVLYTHPAEYRWAPADALVEGDRFETKVAAPFAEVHERPDPASPVLGRIELGLTNDTTTVTGVENGWYKVVQGGKEGWIPGWLTTGPK